MKTTLRTAALAASITTLVCTAATVMYAPAAFATTYKIAGSNAAGSASGNYTYSTAGSCLPGGFPTYDAKFSGTISGSSVTRLVIDYNECLGGSWEPKTKVIPQSAPAVWSETAVEAVTFHVCTWQSGTLRDCQRLKKVS